MQNCIEKIAFPQMVIEKELKSSDRGCVYLVRDKETRTRYIYRAFAGNGEVYRRMHGIDCPQLPTIHEVKEENGMVYVLEEYVQGDTLAFLLEGKPLVAAHAKQIIIQVCYALHILHGIGAVHRDIKPENIIMRGSDAVLIDFDASRLRKSTNTTDTQIMGTTGYAAPEQYGFSQTDARTDIYALGILLNEMLTGQHPSKQLAEGEFRPIIQKCTQINADQRYSSVMELIAAFNPPPQAHKHPIHNSLLLLLAFVILLGGGLMYRRFSAKEVPVGTQNTPSEAQEMEELKIPKEPLRDLPKIDVFVRERQEITMEPWELSTEGYATPFKCDMDGDGEMESYLFGVDFIDSPHKNIVYYDRNGRCIRGDENRRDVHPCVWRVYGDGSMEVATEFAELLTDAYVKIWRVDDFTTPEPIAWTMDYVWPGCVSVTFYPVQDGTWLYEVGAYLGEYHLTAIATTSFYFE